MKHMIIKQTLLTVISVIAILFTPLRAVHGQINFSAGSSFSYLKGNEAATLDAGWMNEGFNDSQWSTGSAPIRYGDGTGGTLLSDMQNNYSVVYMRAAFTASNIELLNQLFLSIDFDDGFVIWINGQQTISINAPPVLSHDAFASDMHESGIPEGFYFEPGSVNLREGENTLAIQGFNISLESTDFLIDVGMSAGSPHPPHRFSRIPSGSSSVHHRVFTTSRSPW